jgi:prevent-host-death family protein
MSPRITATDAKNNFGGLLDQVTASGRVDITKHGRVVAVVLSLAELRAHERASATGDETWGKAHMIPPALARAARIVSVPADFDVP